MTTQQTGPEAVLSALGVRRSWWLFLITGVLWVIASIVIFRFDYRSVTAISVLFGIVALVAGASELVQSSFATTGWRIVRILLAIAFFATGILSFIHPGDTFVGLAAIISFYLIFQAIFTMVGALTDAPPGAGRVLLVVLAIGELLLGFWAAGSWDLSAVILVAWVGAITLMRGITEIVFALGLREPHRL